MASKSSKSAPVSLAHQARDEAQAQAQAIQASEATFGTDAIVKALGGGANAKDVRRWVRANVRLAVGADAASEALPGKGGRYAFTAQQVEALAAAYVARKAQQGTNAPAGILMAALAPATGWTPEGAPVTFLDVATPVE